MPVVDMEGYTQVSDMNDADAGGQAVSFYNRAVKNDIKSIDEGRLICDNVVHIKVMIPGDRNNIVDREAWVDKYANMADNNRYPKAWKRFQDKSKEPVGTPLEAWPVLSPSQVAELQFFNVNTIEQLAQLSDEHAGKFMGINELRQKARDMITASKDNAWVGKMRDESLAKDIKIADLERIVKEQGEKIQELASAMAKSIKAATKAA